MFDPTGPVLGIDPGLSRCGYGGVTRRQHELDAVAYGVLETTRTDPLPDRLAELEAKLAELVAAIGPSALVVERVLFQANVRTAMTVGQASGLALAVAARADVPVTHYSPNEVKAAVAGYGGADKAQVRSMVMRMLRLDEPPRPADASDALALALCHASGGRVRALADDAPTPGTGYQRAVAAALAKESLGGEAGS